MLPEHIERDNFDNSGKQTKKGVNNLEKSQIPPDLYETIISIKQVTKQLNVVI